MERQGETGKEQAFHMDSRQKQEGSGMDNQQKQGSLIADYGQITLSKNRYHHRIHLLNIIGEIEGHENLGSSSKTSKYEHILPQLAAVEDDEGIDGLMVLLNTVGGDVEAGLAIAEMIASISKPSVSLVLGGSHSIGVPLAVSTDYSFIVPTGTMMIHPVRMNGLIIGVAQTFEYFQKIQDRIAGFITDHSRISKARLMQLMLETGELTKDVGSVLVGEQAVSEGLIDELGGIHDAYDKLYKMLDLTETK